MRRFFLLSIILCYTFLSLDLNVRLHYCHGELAWLQVNSVGSSGCCAHKPPSKDQCCDDEVLDINFEVDQQLTSAEYHKVGFKVFDLHCGLPNELSTSIFDASSVLLKSDRAPPPLRDLRISYCSLIFYG